MISLQEKTSSGIEVNGGVFGQEQMHLKLNAKAFNTLISKLYSDKIGAIVREYSCNAYDSHIAAGKKDTPFDIQLPTVFEPIFVIKDYGTGLDDDKVVQLFGTLFESTKEQTNDQIGSYGLGCKAAYSITTNYTIESRYNGTKSYFVCFKDSNGIPTKPLKTSSEPTDEENGITIKIPVNKDNFSDFKHSLRKQLMMFEPKPNIINDKEFYWYQYDVFKQVGDVTAYKCSNNPWSSDVLASMGDVLYPIDITHIPQEVRNKLRMINQNSTILVISFGLGDIDIPPSREEISYDESTIKLINDKLNEFLEIYVAELTQDIENCDNLFAAYDKWCDVARMSRMVSDVQVHSKFPIPFTCGSISSSTPVRYTHFSSYYFRFEFPSHKVEVYDETTGDLISSGIEYDYHAIMDDLYYIIHRPKYSYSWKPLQTLTFEQMKELYGGTYHIIVADGIPNNQFRSRLIKCINQNQISSSKCIVIKTKAENKTIEDLFQYVKVSLPYIEFTNVHLLTEYQPDKVEKKKYIANNGIFQWKSSSYQISFCKSYDDIEDESVYVKSVRNSPEDYDYTTMVFYKELLSDENKILYSVNKSVWNKIDSIKTEKNWKSLEEWKSEIMNGYEPSDAFLDVVRKMIIRSCCNFYYDRQKCLADIIQHEFIEYMDEHWHDEFYVNRLTDLQYQFSVQDKIWYFDNRVELIDEYNTHIKDLYQQYIHEYPIVSVYGNLYRDHEKDIVKKLVADYMRLKNES